VPPYFGSANCLSCTGSPVHRPLPRDSAETLCSLILAARQVVVSCIFPCGFIWIAGLAFVLMVGPHPSPLAVISLLRMDATLGTVPDAARRCGPAGGSLHVRRVEANHTCPGSGYQHVSKSRRLPERRRGEDGRETEPDTMDLFHIKPPATARPLSANN